MKISKRAIRRHHKARLKKSRVTYWGGSPKGSAQFLGICLKTPCTCSCPMCGNQRYYWGASFQELRQKLKSM